MYVKTARENTLYLGMHVYRLMGKLQLGINKNVIPLRKYEVECFPSSNTSGFVINFSLREIKYGVLEVIHYLKDRKKASRRFGRRPFVRRLVATNPLDSV